MGSSEELLRSLLLSQERPDFSEGDYFAPLAGLTNQVGSSILQNRDTYGTKDAIAGALITGLLGGGLEGLSNNYQQQQRNNYVDVLLGRSSGKPEGMEQSIFDLAGNQKSVLDVMKADEIADAQRKYNFDRAGKLQDALLGEGFALGGDGKLVRVPQIDPNSKALRDAILRSDDPEQVIENLRVLGFEQGAPKAKPLISEDGAISQIGALPKKLEAEAREELVSAQEAGKLRDFAASQFDQAKGISSFDTLNPRSTATTNMSGIQGSLKTTVQKFLGREMNGPEQERFMQMLPAWNDTGPQIEAKKIRYLDMLDSMSKSTPILDEKGISGKKDFAAPFVGPDGKTYVFTD